MNQQDLKAFDMMTASTDATAVDLFDENKKDPWTKEEMHTALDIAGMTPVVGNAADIFNAASYAIEGEFGNAALSLTAVIPVLGQMAAVRKLAKKSGEKMVTIYRGVDKWYPGKMVEDGKFISPGQYIRTDYRRIGKKADSLSKNSLWVKGFTRKNKEK